LQLTPLRVEQDRGFFDSWKRSNVFPIYSGGATEWQSVGPHYSIRSLTLAFFLKKNYRQSLFHL
jgi:hypothetical protein